MKITRRNALIGLGSLVAGSGALVGTGAFSSVEATRTVNLATSGDSSALLQITPNDSGATGIVDDSGSVVTLAEQNLNQNAVTRFNEALEVTNSGKEDVGLYIDATGIDGLGDGEELDIQKNGGDSIVGSGGAVDLGSSGGSVSLDIVVDLTGTSGVSNITDEITFVAEKSEYSG